MKIDLLKDEAKRLGLRVTKKIRGKRLPLSEKELRRKFKDGVHQLWKSRFEIQKNLYERVNHFYKQRNQLFHAFVEFLNPLHVHHQFHAHHPHHRFQLKEIHAQI